MMRREGRHLNPAIMFTDRRRSPRKPLDRPVRYRVLNRKGEVGLGRTINMSSTGLAFTTDRPLDLGRGIELLVSWPASLDDGTRLKLVAKGSVVRNAPGMTAVRIRQYEFRTMRSSGVI
jgi:hypothetical protein